MNKLFSAFVFSVFLISSGMAQKIAIVDINAVLTELPEYLEAQTELDKIAAEWNQDIANEYDKIKSLYNKYQAEQVLLSDEVRAQREDEIMQKEAQVRELQKRKFGQEGELFLKRREIINPIQERVFGAIAGVLFASDEFDKTALIKRRLGIR